jgi:hypothetical protein
MRCLAFDPSRPKRSGTTTPPLLDADVGAGTDGTTEAEGSDDVP